MLKDFVALLRKRIIERREKAILENATKPGLSPRAREFLVGKVAAFTEVLAIIKTVLESREDEIESLDDPIDERPRRAQRRAATWGNE